ncbi:MAG: hypothetical protein ACFUZC_14610 [Chthoniobacteraceae bacterium]
MKTNAHAKTTIVDIAGCDGELIARISPVPLTTMKMAVELVNTPGWKPIPSVVFSPRLMISRVHLQGGKSNSPADFPKGRADQLIH